MQNTEGNQPETEKVSKIKTFTTDKFHGARHSAKCPCNPFVHKRLMRRIEGLNTVVAEQTFSWFRNYARTFDDLGRKRHHFLVYLYSSIHNELMESRLTSHLNTYAHRKKNAKSTPYGCDGEIPPRDDDTGGNSDSPFGKYEPDPPGNNKTLELEKSHPVAPSSNVLKISYMGFFSSRSNRFRDR